MLTVDTQVVEDRCAVGAPAPDVAQVLNDVAGWPQLHRPAVHAEVRARGEDGDLVQHWWVTSRTTVRSWLERRTVSDGGRRVDVVHEPAAAPFADVRQQWTVEDDGAGGSVIRVRHQFTLARPDRAEAARQLELARAELAELLASIRYAAEHRAELADLVVAFEDPLYVAGPVEKAYTYLYEADKWPERIPHVVGLKLEQPSPDVQFFDMDTKSADGSAHTTRSVRICLDNYKIVYKQTQPPKTMTAHTGHWLITPTREGFILSARHTATVRPEGMHLLGEGTTVESARRYLRRVLSANSMGNLRLAKAYAEEELGW
uniref:DacK n=1 Tax=Dactylosporangium sp. SC14051 TaxID=1239282 RepID=K4I6A8_9ACTN|nr:DacK [Dactylosporangium sp. SC14051]